MVDAEGRPVGRIEEVLARRHERHLVVTEYHLGAYALMERLAGSAFARALLNVLPFTRPTLYRVRWPDLDISDPTKPRLRHSGKDLKSPA